MIITFGRAAYNRIFDAPVEGQTVVAVSSNQTTHEEVMEMVSLGFRYLWPPFNAPQGHDCATAIYWFTKAAELGDAHAQSLLGQLYSDINTMTIQNCTCAPTDLEKSVYWFRRASNQDDAEGHVGLGVAYRDGIVVERDIHTAIRLFRLSAGRGHSTGMHHLGFSYLHGDGAEQSYERALFWIRQSAELWNDFGIYTLGYMYENGHGIERNVEQAIYWYSRVQWTNSDAAIAITRLISEIGISGS